MAFRPPTNHRHLSIQSIPPLDNDLQEQTTYSPLLSSPGVHSPTARQDADEWVVFSPSSVDDASTVTGTNPLSRVSEIGSLESAPRILRHGRGGVNYSFPGTFDGGEDDDDDDDDDYLGRTETDSLQPFRELDNEGPVMLPTHDGLGMFPSSSGVISSLHSLEESLRIVSTAGHTQTGEDTNAKIERWRVEHSQALLDEIEKVTRRKMSVASLRGGNLDEKEARNVLDDEAAFMGPGNFNVEDLTSSVPTIQCHAEGMEEHPETLWRRITRRFIRDIMGIDDELLQIIFGEALPTEAPTTFLHEENKAIQEVEERLLSRLARELGVLVNQYTSHPAGEGAFSTHRENYENDDGVQTPQPRHLLREEEHEYSISPRKRQRSGSLATSEFSSVPQFQFAPTLSHQEEISHATLCGIEVEQDIDEETQANRDSQMRKEYWEQDLGVRVLFSFLKSRFSRPALNSSSTPPPPFLGPIHQHPLIKKTSLPASQAYQNSSRHASLSTKTSMAKVASPSVSSASTESRLLEVGVRSGSSYASQSTKGKEVGGRETTLSSRGSSKSRNRGFYWDVASSVGSGKTGSCIGTGVWAAT